MSNYNTGKSQVLDNPAQNTQNNDTGCMVENAKNELSHMATQLSGQATSLKNKVQSQVQSFQEGATTELNHLQQTATERIQKNPIPYLLSAVGIGLIMGMMIKR